MEQVESFILRINNPYSQWCIKNIHHHSKECTYVHKPDFETLGINPYHPSIIPSKSIILFKKYPNNTFISGYRICEELIQGSPVIYLQEALAFLETHHRKMNTSERNEKGDHIGNFFFFRKDEMNPEIDNVLDEVVVGSFIKRNDPNVGFGLRAYSMKEKKFWEAKDRRIILPDF